MRRSSSWLCGRSAGSHGRPAPDTADGRDTRSGSALRRAGRRARYGRRPASTARRAVPGRGNRRRTARRRRRPRRPASAVGKSWPLASIWVPTRMSASPAWMAASKRLPLLRRTRRIAVDAQARGRRGSAPTSMASRRCVPRPKGSRSTLPQSGQARGTRASKPQWWQRRRWSARCSTRFAAQRRAARDPAAGRTGQHRRIAAPVEEDEALLAALQPACCKPASRAADRPSCNFSRRVSTIRTTGMASATARSGSSSIV
jgi:hypothetical protein